MTVNTPFHFTEPRDQAIGYCDSAISLLDKHVIAPTPTNYAVAYVYSADSNSDLNSEINSKLSKSGVVDGYLFNDLFKRHFMQDETEEIDGYISSLREHFIQAINGVQEASEGVNRYSSVLVDQSNKLDAKPGLEGLKEIIGTLIVATEQAYNSNQKLHDHLEKTQSETSKMREELDRLRKEAVTDGLTGLYNRKALNTRLDELIENQSGSGRPVSVLMLDIDHFKRINDGYGHQIGDEVIRKVAKAVEEHAVGDCFAARYGGEEFTLVLPETDIKRAVEIGRLINEAVKKLILIRRKTNERLPVVSISVGAASLKFGENQEDLLGRADQALYHAKNNGRDQIVSDLQLITSKIIPISD